MATFLNRSNLSERMLALGKAKPEFAPTLEKFADDLDLALCAQSMDPSGPGTTMKLVEEWLWAGKLYKDITGRELQGD